MHEDAAYGISFHGYPVAAISPGVMDLLSGNDAQDTETLMAMLSSAVVSAGPPPGLNYEAELAGARVRIDRVNIPRGEDWRLQRAWFIRLASEPSP